MGHHNEAFITPQVSLDELYNGASRELGVQRTVICGDCEGRGGPEGAVQWCSTCRGSGMQVRLQHLGPGIVRQVESVCRECNGQASRNRDVVQISHLRYATPKQPKTK